MPEHNILICNDRDALNRKAAQLIAQLSEQAIDVGKRCMLALSGGSTPKLLYELLATPEWSGRIDWAKTYLFWGDERYVPPDDPQSNYRMVKEALLSKVAIPAANVHRVHTELPSAEDAATTYERALREVFDTNKTPQFDIILLGLGENGHTASLFPYTTVLKDDAHDFAACYVDEVKQYRLTLTAPVINYARNVIFLVSGASKASVLKEVLYGDYVPDRLPAQLIKPVSGSLIWLVDKPAAAQISK